MFLPRPSTVLTGSYPPLKLLLYPVNKKTPLTLGFSPYISGSKLILSHHDLDTCNKGIFLKHIQCLRSLSSFCLRLQSKENTCQKLL